MTRVLPWQESIGCEGGPVIIANAVDFQHWRGSDPLPRSDRRALHLWSSFTASLPERFRPSGPTGHQFIPGADYGDLERMRDEVFDVVKAQWPGSTISEQSETWIVQRPDGAKLRMAFAPTSEYDRCIRDLGEVKLHTFGEGRSCVVWSVGPGLVEVARTATGKLVLVQVRSADDEESVDVDG